MDLIQTLEQEEIARLNKTIPPFAPGDTVVVQVRVTEGDRERLQARAKPAPWACAVIRRRLAAEQRAVG